MYYKDHSADWWRRNGVIGYACSLLLFSTEGLLLYLSVIESNPSHEMILIGIFLGFFLLLVQMFIQWMSGISLRNALYAQKGEYNVSKAECAKFKTATLWAWTIDFAVFTIIYGFAFSGDLLYIACGVPVAGGIFLILLIIASVRTAKAKK